MICEVIGEAPRLADARGGALVGEAAARDEEGIVSWGVLAWGVLAWGVLAWGVAERGLDILCDGVEEASHGGREVTTIAEDIEGWLTGHTSAYIFRLIYGLVNTETTNKIRPRDHRHRAVNTGHFICPTDC